MDAARARPYGGKGLGLSICIGIIEAHEGTFAIESSLGVGTTVRVALPVSNTPVLPAGVWETLSARRTVSVMDDVTLKIDALYAFVCTA